MAKIIIKKNYMKKATLLLVALSPLLVVVAQKKNKSI
jgi:hypothetical protein